MFSMSDSTMTMDVSFCCTAQQLGMALRLFSQKAWRYVRAVIIVNKLYDQDVCANYTAQPEALIHLPPICLSSHDLDIGWCKAGLRFLYVK